jgi:aryl-alcohol dehydrogenase-like predicted oxidoreductase
MRVAAIGTMCWLRLKSLQVPLEDTLAALDELRNSGKIKHIGVCNFGVQDLKRALATGVPIVSNQICYNLLWRGIEHEVVPFCIEHNIAVLPWSPMGQGLLTGKVKHADDVQPGRQRSRLFSNKRPQQRHGEPGLEDETFASIRKMAWIAEQIGEPLATVSLAWAREQPGITSLLMGARNSGQLLRNLESVKLTLEPTVAELLCDAGADVKRKLGANLDPYESADSTRIV